VEAKAVTDPQCMAEALVGHNMGAPMGVAEAHSMGTLMGVVEAHSLVVSADRSMETLMGVASVDRRWEAVRAVAGPPCMAIPMAEALVVDLADRQWVEALVAVWPVRALTRQR